MKFIFTTCLFFCLVCIDAQERNMHFIVNDAMDNTPLDGAFITARESNIGGYTNESGILKLKLPDTIQSIIVSYLGYVSQEINSANFPPNNWIIIDLKPDPLLLQEATVYDTRDDSYGIQRLRQVENFAIYASKKNELIPVKSLTLNKSNNNSRQVYAKVSGLNIWEGDGAGVQLGIGGRGLSPSRNSNFNTRQNGYDISADALGYPESYYTPPIEAIERIELVRGAASLQYGTQFGGMLNFKFREGEEGKKISAETRQTIGSFGYFGSFNAISGDTKKVNYYSFYQYKKNNGWRPNSELEQHTAFVGASFKLSPNFVIRPEYSFTHYLTQQAGGLTDVQFNLDPRQSNRSRNWFQVDWNLFALNLDYRINDYLKINNKTFALLGGRDALGNLDNINLLDFGENRDFLSDDFANIGNETRLLYRYTTFKNPSVLVIGNRLYRGRTHRRQGDGDDGNRPRFIYNNPDNLEGSDFQLPSLNLSFFAENVFNLSDKWSITPGARFEYIKTSTDGYYRIISKDGAGNIINDQRIEENKSQPRSFLFVGLGSSYKPSSNTEFYTNFSQNYRAINFNDIRVNVGSLRVDENLQDEKGFNAELGLRGKLNKIIDYDLAIYYLSYQDRIGTTLLTEPNPEFDNLVDRTIRFRTNIADADIFGLESLIQLDIKQLIGWDKEELEWSIFSNLSFTQGTYQSGTNPEIDDNDVELIPPFIFKTGIQLKWAKFSAALQYSFTESHFSDASNAIRTPSAIEGVIPSYQVMDLSLAYEFKFLQFEAGVNNLLDEIYFTRRASGYPGPGIIPSTGRYIYLTLGISL